MTEYITRKEKKKIDLGEIVSKSLNKKDKKFAEEKPKYITKKKQEDTTQYITKKQPAFITKKSPEEIREREMTRKNKMGGGSMRSMYRSGGSACAQIKGFGKARRPIKR
jgi:hypothetical protein